MTLNPTFLSGFTLVLAGFAGAFLVAVWVALVCAERLVSGDTADRHDALREALDTAWDALRTRQTESAAARAARLEDRDDVDDDSKSAPWSTNAGRRSRAHAGIGGDTVRGTEADGDDEVE